MLPHACPPCTCHTLVVDFRRGQGRGYIIKSWVGFRVGLEVVWGPRLGWSPRHDQRRGWDPNPNPGPNPNPSPNPSPSPRHDQGQGWEPWLPTSCGEDAPVHHTLGLGLESYRDRDRDEGLVRTTARAQQPSTSPRYYSLPHHQGTTVFYITRV